MYISYLQEEQPETGRFPKVARIDCSAASFGMSQYHSSYHSITAQVQSEVDSGTSLAYTKYTCKIVSKRTAAALSESMEI